MPTVVRMDLPYTSAPPLIGGTRRTAAVDAVP
jgi:hypothetical protein